MYAFKFFDQQESASFAHSIASLQAAALERQQERRRRAEQRERERQRRAEGEGPAAASAGGGAGAAAAAEGRDPAGEAGAASGGVAGLHDGAGASDDSIKEAIKVTLAVQTKRATYSCCVYSRPWDYQFSATPTCHAWLK